ncbi:protein of unknown function [Pseudodesulfovibrio piezophilus C1TLV30]|uniref:Uncharacterized protein n=1 Tax=Pseudodesulfovibrio piezophilus (strain DSM 21447 / JCM 15486 / C1TLV30) TaxID=1322246 RepID=M1WSV5_PSEP2|nr:protein of unknown function [Pseudodesulfovibrio piezophilus C1TLV30]
MIPAQPDDRLALGIEMGTNVMLHSAHCAFVFILALRKAFDAIEHLVETVDIRKHRVLPVPPNVLAVQFAIIVHLDRNHP